MMPNEWDDFAADWDSNDDVRIYAEKAFDSWTRKAAPLVSNLPDSRILDFGCGTGLLTERLAPLCGQIVAVDTSAQMIAALRRKVIEANAENIVTMQLAVNAETVNESAELAEKFDMIVASSVCSFLPDYEATVGHLAAVIKPAGYFVQWDWLSAMPTDRIQRAFEASGLITHCIEVAFTMKSDGESMPVVMGVGQLPC